MKSIQSNKTFAPFLWASSIATTWAISVQNYFYYPSYFDLIASTTWVQEIFIRFNSSDVSLAIQATNKTVAIVISLGIWVSLLGIITKKARKISLILLCLWVLLYYAAEWQAHGYIWGFPLETSARVWLLPLLLLSELDLRLNLRKWVLFLLVLTFVGHGLYALNILPRPAYYIDMTSRAFGTNEETTIGFLRIMGAMDVLVLLAVLFKQTHRVALFYMLIWGFFTSLARPVFNWSSVFIWESIIVWIPEFLERVPHFLLPLGLILKKKLSLIKV